MPQLGCRPLRKFAELGAAAMAQPWHTRNAAPRCTAKRLLHSVARMTDRDEATVLSAASGQGDAVPAVCCARRGPGAVAREALRHKGRGDGVDVGALSPLRSRPFL